MTWVLRQLLAIAVLPLTVTVLLPLWLARRNGIAFGLGSGVTQVLPQVGGLCLLTVGASCSLPVSVASSPMVEARWPLGILHGN